MNCLSLSYLCGLHSSLCGSFWPFFGICPVKARCHRTTLLPAPGMYSQHLISLTFFFPGGQSHPSFALCAEREAFLSLAQPMQELYLAYVSVGPSDLSEKDRIPSILDQLELVAKAAWARPLAPAHCWGQTCPSVAREVLQGLLR